jgi:hypothetical protein
MSDNDPLALQSTEDATKGTGIGANQLLISKHTSVPLVDHSMAVDMTVDLRNWHETSMIRSVLEANPGNM